MLFNSKGKLISYERMIKKLAEADVILFGEYHNNPIAHWMELEITKSLNKRRIGALMIGAEMYKADNLLNHR